MERIKLSSSKKEHPDLDHFINRITLGRYFKNLRMDVLKSIIREAELLLLQADEFIIREGDDSDSELFILVEGSLAILSRSKFIHRLDTPGDVVGEMSVISQSPRSADVVAEVDSKIISFHRNLFEIKDDYDVPNFYIMFSYILAEKLRITTAQSMLRKGERVLYSKSGRVAIIDESPTESSILHDVAHTEWRNAEKIDILSPQQVIQDGIDKEYHLLIVDIEYENEQKKPREGYVALLSELKQVRCPILVVSDACNRVSHREFLITHGADELLGKPYSIVELRNTIRKYYTKYLQDKELDTIERIADTDRLTGLANRRRLDEFLEALLTIYPENKQAFSLIITDVDNFKHYNDTHGHQAGDVVLSKIAAIFYKNVRRGDLAARYGGEEFIMVLPNCPKEPAVRVAEKLRSAVEEEVFPHQEQQPTGNLTSTFGVATYPDDGESIQELIKKADDCLYVGKEKGRNIVIQVEPASDKLEE